MRMNCLHLQLYRDSKDRYKQGQTKASLSLQHFLAVESGFTLDKESNTIAIICQDVTVVLAFDTRERLIQWQVKIANNLGEDQQFLIQISSAPPRTKIATGPARLHVQEHRFCLAQGVPPRLIGCWQISQLRKYGVVENRFCFEGGSQCGRGEGVYVLVTDQGDEICRVLTLAADGKLTSRRASRSASRNASVCESPRKQRNLSESSRFLATDLCSGGDGGGTGGGDGGGGMCGCPSCRQSAAADSSEMTTVWPSAETSCGDYGDTTSVAEFNDKMDGRMGGAWAGVGNDGRSLERCMSCISKLGALSRSSTGCVTANTPSAAAPPPSSCFTPAWTMDAPGPTGQVNCQQNPQEISSANCDEYSVPNPLNDENRLPPASCQFCPLPLGAPPSRPPKPSQLVGGGGVGGADSPLKKKQKKAPMPLPQLAPSNNHHHHHHQCQCHHHQIADSSLMAVQGGNAFENYDIPKLHLGGYKDGLEGDDYYDTPKNIKESLELTASTMDHNNYGNYDTPPPPHPATLQTVQPLHACNRAMMDQDARRAVVCPCHRMMGWAESWMLLPYCRRGNGIENTSLPFHKVKLDGEGRMPVVDKSGEMAIYATVNKLKKTSKHATCEKRETNGDLGLQPSTATESEPACSNYVNVEISNGGVSNSTNNYANLEFAQSLEYYENVRDLASKRPTTVGSTGCQSADKFSTKCGHPSSSEKKPAQDDYLMMEPAKSKSSCGSNFPGYLPMLPISQAAGNGNRAANLTSQLVEKAASVPSLISAGRFGTPPRSEDSSRVPGSAMMGGGGGHHSATSSPYLRRNLMNSCYYSQMINDDDAAAMSTRFVRKRSSSADSTRYIDNLESITERTVSSSSSTQVNNSKNTSVDSLSSQIGGRHTSADSLSQERDLATPVNVDEGEAGDGKGERNEVKEKMESSDSLRTPASPQPPPPPHTTFAPVHIRRSSSIPCKSGHNRDSSSSNDSGVSI
ncbi:hypothetical protein LSTR_LSTR014001, partial [Laodelphax striatellus]